MIKNYLKTAFRNILRNKIFSFINVIGLAVSMAVCLLMITIIHDQYGFDKFHVNKDRIYRVLSHRAFLDYPIQHFATSPAAMAPKFMKEQTGTEKIVRIAEVRTTADADTGEKIVPINGFYTGKDFFNVFSFELIKGDPETVLKEPFSIVLTETVAAKLYDGQNPVGKVINFDGLGGFTITGIAKDPPRNTHIPFETLRSFSTLPILEKNEDFRNVTEHWTNIYDNHTYLLLDEGKDPADYQDYFSTLGDQQYANEENLKVTFELQNLNDITPSKKNLSNQLGSSLPFLVLVFLGGLAMVIMLSACFNYANLSLAKALSRAKEVGIRKTSGAHRKHIFNQFIWEGVTIAFIALVCSFFIFQALIPAFYSLDPHIQQVINLDMKIMLVLYFVIFASVVGMIAGFFPSLYLSRLEPMQVLRNLNNVKLFSRLTIRKVLVVIQFALSLIFIISATITYQQFKYTMQYDLGFERENIVNIPLHGNHYQQFKNEFSKVPEVSDISFCSFLPGVGSLRSDYVQYNDPMDSAGMAFIPVDQSFIANLEVPMLAGSSFPENTPEENERFIIVNQQLLERFRIGSPSEALGEVLEIQGEPLEIIGVMGDFHYAPLDEPIESFSFRYLPDDFHVANVKITSANIEETVEKMKAAWLAMDKVHEFEYTFFDERIQQAYVQYVIMTKIIGFCAFLAITIAGLGLLGMAIYTTATRIKEIGVRKVLGATVSGLVYLLSKGFMKLLLIATLVALPAAYFLNKLWLDRLAFRIDINVFSLLSGTLLMLIIGILAISSQTFKAANSNPVEALRNE
ncbi:ABC transporter permease [Fulvivirgaceae bacterium BMA10]|uniref:ABC transporter permease n=1 Tax=Splendidivirga corallicola TaxID=3051826 RepID=A0ABT8KSJ7_9BACT|nr:ABC transporter permease [Fulvivirgaceae bacterium BMA10]